jgi:hypothetical protein
MTWYFSVTSPIGVRSGFVNYPDRLVPLPFVPHMHPLDILPLFDETYRRGQSLKANKVVIVGLPPLVPIPHSWSMLPGLLR